MDSSCGYLPHIYSADHPRRLCYPIAGFPEKTIVAGTSMGILVSWANCLSFIYDLPTGSTPMYGFDIKFIAILGFSFLLKMRGVHLRESPIR